MTVLDHDQADVNRRLHELQRRLTYLESEASLMETRMRTLLAQREGDYLMAVMKVATLVMVVLAVVVIVTGAL